MEERRTDHRTPHDAKSKLAPTLDKPVWQDQQRTCGQCPYCGQDVDTYPCDRCHTRH